MRFWKMTEIQVVEKMYLDGYGAKRIAEVLGTDRIRVSRKINGLKLRQKANKNAPHLKRLHGFERGVVA